MLNKIHSTTDYLLVKTINQHYNQASSKLLMEQLTFITVILNFINFYINFVRIFFKVDNSNQQIILSTKILRLELLFGSIIKSQIRIHKTD